MLKRQLSIQKRDTLLSCYETRLTSGVLAIGKRKAEQALATGSRQYSEFNAHLLHSLSQQMEHHLRVLAHECSQIRSQLVGHLPRSDDAPGLQQNMQAMSSHLARLHDTFEQALFVARIKARTIDLEPERMAIDLVLVDILNELIDEMDERGIELTAEAETGLPEILCDRKLLTLTLSTLIRQTIKHAGPGTQINLSVEYNHPEMLIKIGGIDVSLFEQQIDMGTQLVKALAALDAEEQAGELEAALDIQAMRDVMQLHGGSLTIRSCEQNGQNSQAGFQDMALITLPV